MSWDSKEWRENVEAVVVVEVEVEADLEVLAELLAELLAESETGRAEIKI